jgi:hypothetical protein
MWMITLEKKAEIECQKFVFLIKAFVVLPCNDK